MRGVFAAPAVLTLYNGSAFAAASSNCVAKEVTNPTYPGPIGAPDPNDTYVRVKLWTLPGNTPSSWIKGADVTALQKPGTPIPYIDASDWQCFVVGDPADVTINTVSVTPIAGEVYDGQPSVGTNLPTQNGAYVALRVDANGQIVGVVGFGVTTTGNSAVHHSCWASFKPTTP